MSRVTFNLLGPQGSGKGTQADALLKRYDFNHFDLGENLRRIEENDGELGKTIATFIDTGKRVPADMIAEVTEKTLKEMDNSKDILFDGLLRALDELEAQKPIFERLKLPLPVIIFLNLDEKTAIERLSNRRICVDCRTRHRISKPTDAEACRRCGGRLVSRHDDTVEAIRQRLAWYHQDTEPVISYMRSHGKVIDIDASPAIAVVTTEIVAKLEAYYQSIDKIPPRKASNDPN